MSENRRWALRLICCGRDDGQVEFDSWEAANSFRESYTSGPAVAEHGYSDIGPYHKRAAILHEVMRNG